MTNADTDYTLKQKNSAYYPIITITSDNGGPRQQRIDMLYLNIVQLIQTNNQITRANIDCKLQQKDSADYTVITITTDNGEPRQQHVDVLCLTIVQLVWTNKKITRTITECALKQTVNTDCTIIATTIDNGAPRQHHVHMLYLNIVQLA